MIPTTVIYYDKKAGEFTERPATPGEMLKFCSDNVNGAKSKFEKKKSELKEARAGLAKAVAALTEFVSSITSHK